MRASKLGEILQNIEVADGYPLHCNLLGKILPQAIRINAIWTQELIHGLLIY
jgi:hypothetical protein